MYRFSFFPDAFIPLMLPTCRFYALPIDPVECSLIDINIMLQSSICTAISFYRNNEYDIFLQDSINGEHTESYTSKKRSQVQQKQRKNEVCQGRCEAIQTDRPREAETLES